MLLMKQVPINFLFYMNSIFFSSFKNIYILLLIHVLFFKKKSESKFLPFFGSSRIINYFDLVENEFVYFIPFFCILILIDTKSLYIIRIFLQIQLFFDSNL